MTTAIPTSTTGLTRSRARVLLTLLLLPVVAYGLMMIRSFLQRDVLPFDRLDLAVLILVLAYCCIATLAAWRRSVYLVRLVTCVYAIVIAGAVCEVGVRLLFPLPENVPWPPMRRISVASNNLPGVTGNIEFTVNDLGVRGRPVHLEDVDLRILCVGGSTTESMYITDKVSWPWLLQDKLAQQLGKSVFVGNAGKAGQFTLHHDYLLSHYPQAHRFEWVVLLCGVNDMMAMLSRRNYEHRKSLVEATTLANSPLGKHILYRELLVVRRLLETSRTLLHRPTWNAEAEWLDESARKRQEALRNRPIYEVPREELQRALAIYRENLHAIITTCQGQKQHLVMMTQPAIYRKDLPEEVERLTWMDGAAYTSAVLEQMMDAFNQAMIEVCRQRGIDCIDLAARLPKDTTVLFDDCHFNIRGCERVGDIVCDFFVSKLASPDHQDLTHP
jgi:hypothetical protein